MEDVAWKCTAAFVLGAATHYFVSTRLLGDRSVAKTPSPSSDDDSDEGARSAASSRSSSGSSEEWEGADSAAWVPHKMVMCVRTDLKMGKGRYSPNVGSW
ncbi:unnamed protein product [Phytophthora lilii]|uniref:Unnamed protein product n=1 Tax=Phytophthora lilii TaxID=2077276 RepID=A0A9W6X5N1_9STRA|nr:unnamed protein product [Phytophthora lilii]